MKLLAIIPACVIVLALSCSSESGKNAPAGLGGANSANSGGTSLNGSGGGLLSGGSTMTPNANTGGVNAQMGGASNVVASGGSMNVGAGGASPAAGAPAVVDSPSRYNLTGFATVGPGTTGGGIVAENDPAYAKVTTPLELANALLAFNKTGSWREQDRYQIEERAHDLLGQWCDHSPCVDQHQGHF